jgi:hypothetical protein
MLLFDWRKVFYAASGDPTEIIRILRMLVENRVPKNKFDKIYAYSLVDFTGESFLVHPERLLYEGYKYTHREIGIYTALASLRPLADYYAYGKVSLNLLYVPDNIKEYITDNRLLSVENNELHFLYERSPSKKEIH